MTKTFIDSSRDYYQAPACTTVVLGTEGVLCASIFGDEGKPGDDLQDGGTFDF